jgi:P4 family phage/plasmid primase-like protien
MVDMTLLGAALAYAKRGWSVIPLHPNEKLPLIKWTSYQSQRATEDNIYTWWQHAPNANVGIVTGTISNIVVLDVDGAKGWEAIVDQGGVEVTLTASTARGQHLYFMHPGFEIRNFVGALPELDFRGDGGYVVAPPSIHPSSAVYTWITDPDTAPIAEISTWLLDLVQGQPSRSGKSNDSTLCRDTILLTNLSNSFDPVASRPVSSADSAGDYWLQRALTQAQAGKRNDIGFRLACQLRDHGVSWGAAESYMGAYQAQVMLFTASHAYTLSEALASLKEAYATPARSPASRILPQCGQQQASTSSTSPFQTGGSNAVSSIPPPPATPPQGPSGGIGGGVPQMNRPANDPGLIRILAEAITRQESFIRDAGNLLYIYRNGVYIPEASHHIRKEVKRLLIAWDKTARWNKKLNDQVEAYIAADAGVLWERPPTAMVNLLNGWLDLETGILHPHDPIYHTLVQLPVRYDPDADCPAWHQFLAEVLPPDVDAAGIIWQLLALLMIPYTDAHQAVLLSGPGGNGKGALLAALRAFLGNQNVSSLNLDQITGQRFAAADLFGKLANICDDLSSKHLGDTSVFKRIVGGDPITADRKYRDPIEFKPYARLLFSANEYPQGTDSSSGYYDRWVVLPFTSEFRGQQAEIPRRILDGQLASPEELSGTLNQALTALRSIQNHRLLMTDSMRTAWDEFRNATDWVTTWLNRMLVEDGSGATEKKTIHQALINEAQRLHRPIIQPGAFYKKIRHQWPHITEGQRRVGQTPNGVECFIGLAWRTGFPPP